MGVIAESFVNYAQPLIDSSDGSEPQLQRAMDIAQLCWNLALLPEEERDAAIDKFQSTLEMTDEEFAEFRQKFVLPMIVRHVEMFPVMHARCKQSRYAAGAGSPHIGRHPIEQLFEEFDAVSQPPAKRLVAGRNDPCPCGSGRKFKRCCGARK